MIKNRKVGRPRVSHSDINTRIREILEENPFARYRDVSHQLYKECGKLYSVSWVFQRVKEIKFSTRRVSQLPLKRGDKATKEKRKKWILNDSSRIREKNVIFIDETHFVPEKSLPLYGKFPRGSSAEVEIKPPKKVSYSMQMAICHEGILHFQIKNTVKEGVKKEDFIQFLRDLFLKLNPAKNFLLIMDNASIHRSNLVKYFVKDCGVEIVFLPPYSPDYNAIELAFGTIKSKVRYKFFENHLLLETIVSSVNDLQQSGVIKNFISHTISLYKKHHILHLKE